MTATAPAGGAPHGTLPMANDPSYDRPVFFALGRRVIFGAVSFFALMGFVSVPLGDKTGWGHVQSILASPATTHAVTEFRGTAEHTQRRLLAWLTSRLRSSSSVAPTARSTEPLGSDGSVSPKTKSRHTFGPVPKLPTF